MVSIMWSVIALSLGLLVYLLPPMLAPMLPMHLREAIGDYYYRQAARSYRQLAIVRRLLSGYELLPIAVDDEQRLAEVTLSSGMVSDDKKLPFKDPDDRISRLYQKPVAVVSEILPAAVDAELAELGHWVTKADDERGLESTREGADGREQTVVNPYVEVDSGLRVSDPMDVTSLVTKGVEPENVESAKQYTKERFREYGDNVGIVEGLATMTGFAFGIGGVAVLQYVKDRLLSNGGGGTGGGATGWTPPMGQVMVDPTALQLPLDVVGVLL